MKAEIFYKEGISKKTGKPFSCAVVTAENGNTYYVFDDALKYAALAHEINQIKKEDKK